MRCNNALKITDIQQIVFTVLRVRGKQRTQPQRAGHVAAARTQIKQQEAPGGSVCSTSAMERLITESSVPLRAATPGTMTIACGSFGLSCGG